MLGFQSPAKSPRPPEDTYREIRAALKKGKAPSEEDWIAFSLNLYDRLVYHERVCERNGFLGLIIWGIIAFFVVIDSEPAKWLFEFLF